MNYNSISSSQLPSDMPENPSTQPDISFDYEKLDTEIRVVVEQRTSEIKNLMRRTTQEIIEIGQKLTDVKAQLEHGNFRNWLKAEFDWSVKTANRFMQVAESFKCDNLTHLDIAASALYLVASPSTPQEARTEVLKLASSGENITYTKAKAIVSEHKKATKSKPEKAISFDLDTDTVSGDSAKSIEQEENETSGVLAPTPASIVNQTVVPEKVPNTIINEIEMRIEQLPSEELAQLTLAIINSAKSRLSNNHFLAIIRAVKEALN